MSEKIISLNNVSKRYDSKFVLKEVSLSIEKGQSIAFIGHNGSGKSTLLKLIAGLISHESGCIDFHQKLKFSYIPEHFPKTSLTPKTYIELAGQLDGLSSLDIKERSEQLLRQFFMESLTSTPMKYLSKGSLQKVGVIQALLATPDVLLLDEPLSGQDSDSQAVFIEKIKELLEQKVTIIMSCHEPYLIESISDTVYRIQNGDIRMVNIDEIRERRLDRLIFHTPSDKTKLSDDIRSMAFKISSHNESLVIDIDAEKSNELLIKMLEAGYTLRRMNHV